MWNVSEDSAALHMGLETLPTSCHNYDPFEDAALHAINRRPTEAEKQEILRLDRDMVTPVLPRPIGIMQLVLTGIG